MVYNRGIPLVFVAVRPLTAMAISGRTATTLFVTASLIRYSVVFIFATFFSPQSLRLGTLRSSFSIQITCLNLYHPAQYNLLPGMLLAPQSLPLHPSPFLAQASRLCSYTFFSPQSLRLGTLRSSFSIQITCLNLYLPAQNNL